MSYLESFYLLLFHPLFFLKQSRKPVSLAFITLALATLASISLLPSRSLPGGIILFFFSYLSILIILFFLALFYHYFSELMGGRGKATSLFLSFLYSFIPLSFASPIYITLKTVKAEGIFPLLFLLILFYCLFLQINALKINYTLEDGTAVFIYFLPWILSIVLLLLILFISFFLFALMFFKFSPLPLTF